MGDDDLGLNASDLMDIFGQPEEASEAGKLGNVLEELFLDGGAAISDDDEIAVESAPVSAAPAGEDKAKRAEEAYSQWKKSLVGGAASGTLETPKSAGGDHVPQPGSPEYEAFRRQVIERYEKRRQEEEAALNQAHAEEEKARQAAEAKQQAEKEAYEKRRAAIVARYEAELQAKEREEALKKAQQEEETRQKDAEEKRQAEQEAYEARRQAILEKYKQQRKEEEEKLKAALEAPKQEEAREAEKEQKFREYLQKMKAQMGSGGLPSLTASKPHAAPAQTAGKTVSLDLNRCLTLAAMFEETRIELIKKVADKIGSKAAKTMMAKTLEKILKVHGNVFSRAAVDAKGKPLPDGALDPDRLARTFYSFPEGERSSLVQKPLFELIDMRFIAIELGLGVRTKGFVVSQALTALEQGFKKKSYPPDLVQWYISDVVPSTVLSDGDESTY